MKISIITVTYNSEKTLSQTIESVARQTVPPYEYLIIDGASSDDTIKIAESYQKIFEKKRICYRIQSEKDQGIYDAMNKGVRKTTGDYVAMLNSDDWYEPRAIEIVQESYQKEKFDLGYGSIGYIGKKGKILVKKSRLDQFVSSRNWNHPSTFVKRELCLKYPFDLRWKIYADFDWFLKLRRENVKITIFPGEEIITNFCAGGVSINKSLEEMKKRAKEKYAAYRKNNYGKIYLAEAYGWEFVKYCFARLYS